ncbi:aminotransferase class V-fold PLP-dependent enzyme [Parabacteroides sp. PF5-9]|uniref:aminotransferase class V-fold PLP-dependent enzyme n=1 Tax=Parabacteroides sp. PF5-9 TaxID=1742404 RepID=UPI0024738293|nr:aminotransferase class V-fold PLP-dependent enzyme [Parabacteroides sp. PF5-9]MDH6357798.1 perosamine synthetase [Parabacteroides sp. PF5-9]
MSIYRNATTALVEYLEQIEQDDFSAYNHLSGNGVVESFESTLKDFYGVKYALCVDSATNALMYLALAVGLKNKEIVTSPLSYGATISGALWLNNKFHFADIDNSLNIAPESVKKIIKGNPKIKALYAVDFAGIPHDMHSIRQICDEFGVWYFADAAQSLGAEVGRMKASSLADAFVVSFSPGKTIFCGEGACILTNDSELYKRLVSITQHPYRIKKDVSLGASSELGLNGRMNPLSAIVGNAMFDESLQRLKQKQIEILNMYNSIDKFHFVTPFHFEKKNSLPSFFHLPLLINDLQEFERESKQFLMTAPSKCHFRKSAFELLPEQLKRMGKSRIVLSIHTQQTSSLIEKLFLGTFHI